MRLCLNCGLIDRHGGACAQRSRTEFTPGDKAGPVKQAMAEVERLLAEVGKAAPKVDILALIGAEDLLERNSSRDLPTFDVKRAHNELVSKAKKKRLELSETIEEGSGFVDLVAFAKRAFEKLFELNLRRHEVASFDVSAIGQLPTAGLDPTQKLSGLGSAIERFLEETKNLDHEVASWGWKNLRPLMTGREPADIPQELTGGGITSYLGAFVGRGPGTRKIAATTRFKLLGEQFRERLFLLGANSSVLRVQSRLDQAEESWRRILVDDKDGKWDRVKADPVLVAHFLGEENAGGDVEETVAAMAARSPSVAVRALRPYDSIDSDEWDVLAKAYLMVFAAVMSGQSSRDVGLETVSGPVLELRNGKRPDPVTLSQALQSVRDAWHARPPRDVGEKPESVE